MVMIVCRCILPCCLLLAVASFVPQPTVIKLAPDELTRLKSNGPIYAVHTEHDALFVANRTMTSGGALGFLIGAALGESQGNRIARENGLRDPVYTLKELFLAALARSHGITNVKVVEQTRKDGDQRIEKLRADFGDGNVL